MMGCFDSFNPLNKLALRATLNDLLTLKKLIMLLDIPIPVQFSIKMETDKAYIVNNVTIQDTEYVKEAVLPKMYTIIEATDDKFITTAKVEKWVLQQRRDEEKNVDVDMHVQELLAELPV